MTAENFFHMMCPANGDFPNNDKLDLCIYRQVFPHRQPALADMIESRFMGNSWPPAWRNGLYDIHHFHSTAHEVLGVYSGWVEACFGGPGGVVERVSVGDVLVIPAGVSHRNIGQSPDFRVVGAYPQGQRWNMRYGKPEERAEVDREINQVVLPVCDPVYGADGPLMNIWK